MLSRLVGNWLLRCCPDKQSEYVHFENWTQNSDERCGVPDTGGGGHNDTETCHVANGREIGFQNALKSQR